MVVVAAATTLSCRRQDVRTVLIEIPEMATDELAQTALRAAASIPGVRSDKCSYNLPTRTLTITFDSLSSSLKNIEVAIADAGFTANDVPANAEAKRRLVPAPQAVSGSPSVNVP
jgi:copper chaperone CopZ